MQIGPKTTVGAGPVRAAQLPFRKSSSSLEPRFKVAVDGLHPSGGMRIKVTLSGEVIASAGVIHTLRKMFTRSVFVQDN